MHQPPRGPQQRRNRLRPIAAAAALTALAALLAQPAHAGDTIDLGHDTTLDYSVTASYGAALRTGRQSDALLSPANINGDDGDRNFKRGDMIANRVSLLGEAHLKRNAFGVLLRGSVFYDWAYSGTNSNNAPFTVNHSGPFNQFTSSARDYHEHRAQLLDAYVYGATPIGGTQLSFKLGNQVVAWGESLFFANIAGAQGPADATKAFVPGAEVKDILLPVPQASLQLQVTPSFSVMGYYQFTYKPNQMFAPGSYFSTTDVVGPGAEFIIGPGFNIPRGPDIRPSDWGQWGVGARFRVFEDTEIGIYQLRYHDKNPSVVTSLFPTLQYQQKFYGGINLTGASFSTQLLGANVAGEVSYKDGVPMLVDVAGSPTATRGKALQGQLSAIYSVGPTFLADSQSLLGEVSYLHVLDVDPVMGFSKLSNTRNSAAFQVGWSLTYNNVFDGWDVTVPLTYAQQFSGRSAVAGAFGTLMGYGDKRASVGLTFKYLNNLELNLTYAAFIGGANIVNRPLADRDYVAFNAKYSF
ncbi:DUF1302 domain-containing protein [Cupriavidus alkaliphilus]|uniref:DUF1302 domain-containing protein n=1 Tax=Cupriavidus alkaliphilus TaxID=942866 RepID=UPI000DC41866|nr:DUF1302 family protein [Cupriavidus alkaliphilus]RAS09379.1 uncharacterized protein DUF1302 [Cupriavidus alkaliphilus]